MGQDSAFMSSLMNYIFRKFEIKVKTVAPYNHQSLQAEHGIKSLSTILMKHLAEKGQMWHKYLPLATFTYNTFTSPNLANHSPSKLVFGRKPKLLLDLETDPDIKTVGTYKQYYMQLRKRLQNLHKLLQDARTKNLALMNKDRDYLEYNSRDLVYIISPLTSQLRTASIKIAIKYRGPLVVYKIVDPHTYLWITLDGKLLRGLFEHEGLKPAVMRTNQGNVTNVSKLRQVMALGLLEPWWKWWEITNCTEITSDCMGWNFRLVRMLTKIMTEVPSQITILEILRWDFCKIWRIYDAHLSRRTLQMDTQKKGRTSKVITNLATG